MGEAARASNVKLNAGSKKQVSATIGLRDTGDFARDPGAERLRVAGTFPEAMPTRAVFQPCPGQRLPYATDAGLG